MTPHERLRTCYGRKRSPADKSSVPGRIRASVTNQKYRNLSCIELVKVICRSSPASVWLLHSRHTWDRISESMVLRPQGGCYETARIHV